MDEEHERTQKRLTKAERRERRRNRRERLAQEKQARRDALSARKAARGRRRVVEARLGRRGGPIIRFDFTSSVVVPFDPAAKDPTAGISARVALHKMLEEKAKSSPSN